MLAAAVFFQIGFPGRPTVTPVHDDLELVLRAERRLENREEVPAPELIAGDDAQVRRPNGHHVLRASLRDCKPDVNSFAILLDLMDVRTLERKAPKHALAEIRVKTQGSLPSEDAALVQLFSLVASGQIGLRRIDGWRKIGAVLSTPVAA